MKKILVTLALFVFSSSTFAYEVPEKDWGIAATFRIARIPYPSAEKQVADFIPLMFYDGDLFFMRGLTGGIKLYNKNEWQFSLITRYRFFDIPAEFQNLVRGNALDLGGELKYRITDEFESSIEIMSDNDSRYYSTLNTRYHWDHGSWDIIPYATLRYKSADFNDYYFGLDGFTNPNDLTQTFSNKIGSGTDLTLGSEIRYHVTSNLYLLGRAQITTLDSKTRDSLSIERGTFGEVYLGFAFFNDKTRKKAPSLKAKPYIRVARGWGTPSNIGDVLAFNWVDDEQNSQITSIFYGHPITDSLFGIELIDAYVTTGYVYHHSTDTFQQTLAPGSGINTPELAAAPGNTCDGTNPCNLSYAGQPTNEYVLGLKIYFNITWPVHWRIGLAEGLSYIETVSDLEQREMDRKGYRSSNLMNYIDFTADFSLGDTFGAKAINDLFLGVGVHHRSSIFETSSAFGRIKGGSNFPSVYLQYHF
ncbi:MAG: MipA/OmpV family protein [Gammaproteobacteria bacterium]